jgi:ElaB/YqjD/DUF883 family membrane-anchored ribosome-binding protein
MANCDRRVQHQKKLGDPMEHVALDQMIEDLKRLIEQGEELLRSAADRAGSELGAVKVKAKNAYKCVRENPWASIGIAASVAFLLGLLLGRRD